MAARDQRPSLPWQIHGGGFGPEVIFPDAFKRRAGIGGGAQGAQPDEIRGADKTLLNIKSLHPAGGMG